MPRRKSNLGRLSRNTRNSRAYRKNETEDQKRIRRLVSRERNRERIANETPEQRDTRLSRGRQLRRRQIITLKSQARRAVHRFIDEIARKNNTEQTCVVDSKGKAKVKSKSMDPLAENPLLVEVEVDPAFIQELDTLTSYDGIDKEETQEDSLKDNIKSEPEFREVEIVNEHELQNHI